MPRSKLHGHGWPGELNEDLRIPVKLLKPLEAVRSHPHGIKVKPQNLKAVVVQPRADGPRSNVLPLSVRKMIAERSTKVRGNIPLVVLEGK